MVHVAWIITEFEYSILARFCLKIICLYKLGRSVNCLVHARPSPVVGIRGGAGYRVAVVSFYAVEIVYFFPVVQGLCDELAAGTGIGGKRYTADYISSCQVARAIGRFEEGLGDEIHRVYVIFLCGCQHDLAFSVQNAPGRRIAFVFAGVLDIVVVGGEKSLFIYIAVLVQTEVLEAIRGIFFRVNEPFVFGGGGAPGPVFLDEGVLAQSPAVRGEQLFADESWATAISSSQR